MSVRLGSALFAALVLFASAVAPQEAYAAGNNRLVNPAASGTLPPQANARAVARSRAVTPDLTALGAARDTLADQPTAVPTLEIPFFDDVVVNVVINRVERLANRVTNYYGTIPGDPLGRAVITDSRGFTSVTVFTRGKTYKIRPQGNGYLAQEINNANLADHQGDTPVPPNAGAKAAADAPLVQRDGAGTIDVMVMYTSQARIGMGGTAQMLAEIDNGIAVSNSAYNNSGVTQQVRLVHAQEISYLRDTNAIDLLTVLNDLTAGANGLATVASLRNTYGADIVSFWIEGDAANGGVGNGGCGIGWLMDPVSSGFAANAMHVVLRVCAVDNQSFPHEMGHNMGLRHDLFVDNSSTPYPYAHGYVDAPNGFRTIMAYNNACSPSFCTRINQFSSPTHLYTGFVTGNGTADSATVLNATAPTVANFRTAVVGPGTLQMKAATKSVSEGVGTAAILVSRVGGAVASVGAVSVDYTVADGTAFAAHDYTSVTGTLNWADGDTADKTISVPIIQNAVIDGTRTFTVTIANPGGGAALGSPLTTTVSIQDDEASVSFAGATSSISEGATTALTIPVTRVGTAAMSVTWTTGNGTALAGTDYGTLNNVAQKTGTLTWAAGDATAKNITVGLPTSNVPVINDTNVEGPKAFTITLSNPTGGAQLGLITVNTVTINDTDSVIQFAAPTISVNENGPNVTMNVTRTGYTAGTQSITYTTLAGTALATTDFTTTAATITFNPGDTTKTITIGPNAAAAPYVKVVNDATIEGPEVFTIKLSAPTGGALVGPTSALTVTIFSDENGVSMVGSALPTVEGAGVIAIPVYRSGSTGAVDVNYAFGGGTAVNGVHYQGINGSLHWNDGETGQKTINANILDDTVINPPRTFMVTLSGALGATLVSPMGTTVTIADNDNTVQFTAATATVAENALKVALNVSRMGVLAQSAGVHWAAVDGAAVAGTDYGTLGNPTPPSGDLVWNAGVGTAQVINIPIINNAILNGARNFTVQLSAPTGSGTLIGANPVANVTLNDDERGLVFAQPGYTITEGGSTAIKVKRIGPVTTAITATWTTVNGTAISGTDFGAAGSVAARSGTLSWAIGDGADKTITIASIQNLIGGQPDRTFTVNLTPSSGVVLGSPGSTVVTIQDDDIPPQSNVRFDTDKIVVLENVGNAVLTLHREDAGGGFGLAASVKYSTLSGTALATTDFVAVTGGTVSWAAGDSTDKQVSIGIVNNTTAEPPKAFKVQLSSPTAGLGFGTPNQASVTILDDDELFPPHGAIPAGFAQAAGATKGWHVSNDPSPAEGAFALKSDEIDDGETAGLEMTGMFAGGNVSFKVKISSEPTYDVLRFYIDGVLQQSWSGTAIATWQASSSFPVSPGPHTLKWAYEKDGSVSVGMDAAYIDALVTPAFVP